MGKKTTTTTTTTDYLVIHFFMAWNFESLLSGKIHLDDGTTISGSHYFGQCPSEHLADDLNNTRDPLIMVCGPALTTSSGVKIVASSMRM